MSSSSFSLSTIGPATSSADSAPAQSRSTPSRSTSRPRSRNFASSSSSLSGPAEDRSGLPLRTNSLRTPSLSTRSWQIRSRVTYDIFTRSSVASVPTYPRHDFRALPRIATLSRMAAKKRRSGRGKGPRQGISGNPQRRAEQLAQRLDSRSGNQDSPLLEMAYALAGGADPRPWWDESHHRILAAARALTWPSRLVDVETQACQIVGDEFYERLNSESSGMHSSQWLRALAEETGAELRASVAAGTGDWPQLWALLRGLALTVPPGDPQSETAKLARETFPDIKDPYETVLAAAAQAAKLLADRGLTAGLEHPADGARPAGNPLIACDAYGSRYLLVAPFGYDGEEVDHWYAWDIDSCWLLNVVEAGVFGSAQDALAEWQHAVGPAAGTELSPGAPELTARLLAPCLATGPMSDMLEGSEPRELIREYYRLRRRARSLTSPAD